MKPKKLKLEKKVISNLNKQEMEDLKGGYQALATATVTVTVTYSWSWTW